MCAIYGCPVEASADPIEASSRTFRVTALQRRFNGIGRGVIWVGVVVVEGIWAAGVIHSSINPHSEATLQMKKSCGLESAASICQNKNPPTTETNIPPA
jgi:hypothetical protein